MVQKEIHPLPEEHNLCHLKVSSLVGEDKQRAGPPRGCYGVPGHLGPGAAGARAATSPRTRSVSRELRAAAPRVASGGGPPPAFRRRPRGPGLRRKVQLGGNALASPHCFACANDSELIHMAFWYARNQK
ncbi:uncharacterized protein [Kogia breviceps]|uniref:uncharacterized protein n=1 Tax=Kogia breviceps TaxID=27615 RepID=UPI0034D2F13F